MVTELKKSEVEALRGYFEGATCAVFAEYRGVTSGEMDALRAGLRQVNTKLKVVKNTLARIAAQGTRFEKGVPFLEGPMSVAFNFGDDISAPAKKMLEFAKEHQNLKILGAVVEGAALDGKGVETLSQMPPKPVVRAQLLGLFQAPARNMLGVMEGVARKFLYAVTAIAEKKKENAQG